VKKSRELNSYMQKPRRKSKICTNKYTNATAQANASAAAAAARKRSIV